MSHKDHIQILQDYKNINKVPSHLVPSTMLYGFINQEIVGRLSIRHFLNENLQKRGGHIGYSVSPLHRRKGYAKEMFKQGLEYCRHLGLKKILITCSDENEPSWKIIESFNAVLENKIYDEVDEEVIRRYWLEIT